MIIRAIFYLSLFSFLFFGMWEWMQSPFFIDITDDFNMIVWFRIHSTIGDILILITILGLISLLKKEIFWIFQPGKRDYFLIAIMGLFYTVYVNT